MSELEVDALLSADDYIVRAMKLLAETGDDDMFTTLSMIRKGITDRLHQLNRKK